MRREVREVDLVSLSLEGLAELLDPRLGAADPVYSLQERARGGRAVRKRKREMGEKKRSRARKGWERERVHALSEARSAWCQW